MINRYEGYNAPNLDIQSHNNGLLPVNKRIKEDDLQYTQYPFLEFLDTIHIQ